MHLASLEDHLQTPVGQQVPAFSVVRRQLSRLELQADVACEDALQDIAGIATPRDSQASPSPNQFVEVEELSGLETPRDDVAMLASIDVHIKVVQASRGQMKLIPLPLASGRRVELGDTIVSVHDQISTGADGGVMVADAPRHVVGQFVLVSVF